MGDSMNRLQLKALLSSVMMEIKHGAPITRNAIGVKNQYKKMVGLPKNASNMTVLQTLGGTYADNGLAHEFKTFVRKFGFQVD